MKSIKLFALSLVIFVVAANADICPANDSAIINEEPTVCVETKSDKDAEIKDASVENVIVSVNA